LCLCGLTAFFRINPFFGYSGLKLCGLLHSFLLPALLLKASIHRFIAMLHSGEAAGSLLPRRPERLWPQGPADETNLHCLLGDQQTFVTFGQAEELDPQTLHLMKVFSIGMHYTNVL
jgi:hypothetical protein